MGGEFGEKVGLGRDGPELDPPLRVQTQLWACRRRKMETVAKAAGATFPIYIAASR